MRQVFGCLWNATTITTYVDDPSNVILSVPTANLWNRGGWSNSTNNPWTGGSASAPFDQGTTFSARDPIRRSPLCIPTFLPRTLALILAVALCVLFFTVVLRFLFVGRWGGVRTHAQTSTSS